MNDSRMQRVAMGDSQAFAEIVEEFSGRLTGTAFAKLRDWGMAEDCCQHTLMKVWSHAAGYRPGNFEGWLFSILKHKIIDVVRRRKHDPLRSRQNPDAERDPMSDICVRPVDPADTQADKESLSEIAAAMDAIPNDQRAVLELFNEGWSFPEIAEASNTPLATAKSRARMARDKIRERISL